MIQMVCWFSRVKLFTVKCPLFSHSQTHYKFIKLQLRKSDPYGRFRNPILITIYFYDFISPFTLLSVVFSTNFSVLGNVIKHCLSCLTDYLKVIMIYLDRIQHSQTSGPHSRSCFRRAKLLLGEILVQKLGRQLCCKLLLVITGRLYHLLLHRMSTSAWSGSDFCSKHWVPAPGKGGGGLLRI